MAPLSAAGVRKPSARLATSRPAMFSALKKKKKPITPRPMPARRLRGVAVRAGLPPRFLRHDRKRSMRLAHRRAAILARMPSTRQAGGGFEIIAQAPRWAVGHRRQ